MRVLVTGANGFAGRHVIDHLLQTTDWRIAAVDVTLPERDGDPRIDRYVFDLRNPVPESRNFGNTDVVINLAASSDVTSFFEDPYRHVLNNVAITLNLLQWSLTQDLQMFIQVSTNEVYGPTDAVLSREWDPLIPATPYSASKAAQEMLAIAWHQSLATPTVVINTSHLFGERQPMTKFIPTAVKKILRNESVPIYGRRLGPDPWEASIRNWTYVGNFAHALAYVIERGTNGYVDRWNVAGPVMNCEEVADGVADLVGLPLSIEWQDSGEARPGYEHHYALDPAAFERYGFVPYYGFDEGLKRTVDWYVERLQK